MTAFNTLCGVNFLARFSYALARNPVLPLFALFLGAGPEAIGLAVGISTVTGIFFKLPSGALSDIIGRRKTMLAGLVVFAVMPFSYLFLTSYSALLVVRFLHGLATAIYGPVAMAVVAETAGERKGEMLSWFSSVAIIGSLLGAPIGGFILDVGPQSAGAGPVLWQFRLVFALSALSGVAALALALRVLPPGQHASHGAGRFDAPGVPGVDGVNGAERPGGPGTPSEKRAPFTPTDHSGLSDVAPPTGFALLADRLRQFASGIREVLSDRRIVAVSAMEGLQNMTMGALEAFLPVYAVMLLALSEFQAGLLWGAQIVVTMLSKPLMGRFSDARGRRPLVVAGLVLCGVSFSTVPFMHGFWSLLAVCLVFGLGESLITSSSAAMVADLCRQRHFGSAMGAFGTIFDVGHASGPILAGLLVGLLGYQASFPLMGLPLLLAVPVFLRRVPAS